MARTTGIMRIFNSLIIKKTLSSLNAMWPNYALWKPRFHYTIDTRTTQVWTMQVRSYANFFNKYTVNPPSPWVSHLGSQPTVDQKTVFLIQSWELLMWRAYCIHQSMPLYIMDLNIHRFWYLWRRAVLEPNPVDTKGWQLNLGEWKVICGFLTAWRSMTINLTLFRGQLQ